MDKVVLFAFNGEPMCFVHALLNALDLGAKGHEVKLVVEGSATKLAPELDQAQGPLGPLFEKVKQAGLLAGFCRACSHKMGVLAEVQRQGLPLLDDMQGHPSMAAFMDQGYTVITF